MLAFIMLLIIFVNLIKYVVNGMNEKINFLKKRKTETFERIYK